MHNFFTVRLAVIENAMSMAKKTERPVKIGRKVIGYPQL